MLVPSPHEIITPENYKFFKGVNAMDKITHQVRAEHWAKILNECMNSGMSKTAWCRANGISEKQFFYWQRILRREAYEASQNLTGSASCAGKLMKHLRIRPCLQLQRRDSYLPFRSLYLLLRSNFLLCYQMHHPFSIRIL